MFYKYIIYFYSPFIYNSQQYFHLKPFSLYRHYTFPSTKIILKTLYHPLQGFNFYGGHQPGLFLLQSRSFYRQLLKKIGCELKLRFCDSSFIIGNLAFGIFTPKTIFSQLRFRPHIHFAEIETT